eukprot:1162146-Pelagomonas_calceolata.AAC.7
MKIRRFVGHAPRRPNSPPPVQRGGCPYLEEGSWKDQGWVVGFYVNSGDWESGLYGIIEPLSAIVLVAGGIGRAKIVGEVVDWKAWERCRPSVCTCEVFNESQ